MRCVTVSQFCACCTENVDQRLCASQTIVLMLGTVTPLLVIKQGDHQTKCGRNLERRATKHNVRKFN